MSEVTSLKSSFNKQFVQLFFDGVFNKGKLELIETMLSPNYMYNGERSNPQELKALTAHFKESYPQLTLFIDKMVCEKNEVVTFWRVKGQNAQSGDSVGASGACTMTIENEKITATQEISSHHYI